jgi:hypothetical protein
MQCILHPIQKVLKLRQSGIWHWLGGVSCFIRKNRKLQVNRKVATLDLPEEGIRVLEEEVVEDSNSLFYRAFMSNKLKMGEQFHNCPPICASRNDG